MRNYVVITVPQDLLPQVTGELLEFTNDPNDVDVYHGTTGREIHVHPEVANAWYQARMKAAVKEEESVVADHPPKQETVFSSKVEPITEPKVPVNVPPVPKTPSSTASQKKTSA